MTPENNANEVICRIPPERFPNNVVSLTEWRYRLTVRQMERGWEASLPPASGGFVNRNPQADLDFKLLQFRLRTIEVESIER